MSEILVVAELKAISGIKDDDAQNTWAFQNPSTSAPTDVATAAFTKLATFYSNIGMFIGPSIDRTAGIHTLTAYDLAAQLETPGAGLGTPIATGTFTITAPTVSVGLPAEVSTVLSFHASLVGSVVEVGSTRPRSRRTGRVYIGPLSLGTATGSGPNFETRPTTGWQTSLKNAAVALLTGADAIWSVYSRVDHVLRAVDGGWVDNAFDTQRRRGVKPTSRQNWGSLT